MTRHIAQVLPSIQGCDSWARDKVGNKYIVEAMSSSNYYVVVEDGKKTKCMLPRNRVSLVAVAQDGIVPEDISRIPEGLNAKEVI